MDTIDEHAHETIHEHGRSNRVVAVLIATLAAALALAEMGEKQRQNDYLTHHIALSDHYAFFQAKNVRATVLASEAEILSSNTNAQDPPIQEAIKRAKATESRLRDEPGGDGMKQLSERAKVEEHDRDEAFHQYHQYELVVGALQISIVLASVAIVTNVPLLAIAAGVIGALAAAFGVYVTLA